MIDFLVCVKSIVDVFGSCGDLVLSRKHLDVVLEALTKEYSLVTFVIKSNFDPLLINEVKALLLAHESHIYKFMRKLIESPSINIAHKGSYYIIIHILAIQTVSFSKSAFYQQLFYKLR